MRARAAAVLVAAAIVFGAGAALGAALVSSRGEEPPAPALRPDDLPGPDTVVVDGQLAFRVLGWRCGIRAVIGDHADWLPEGQYCRVRLRVANRERSVTRYDTSLQALRDGDREFSADLNAVSISDQPTTTEMKGRAVQEFDVWFELPAAAEPEAIVLRAGEASAGVALPLGRP